MEALKSTRLSYKICKSVIGDFYKLPIEEAQSARCIFVKYLNAVFPDVSGTRYTSFRSLTTIFASTIYANHGEQEQVKEALVDMYAWDEVRQ
jgi:hypothetical protein